MPGKMRARMLQQVQSPGSTSQCPWAERCPEDCHWSLCQNVPCYKADLGNWLALGPAQGFKLAHMTFVFLNKLQTLEELESWVFLLKKTLASTPAEQMWTGAE